jgi:ribosomal protein S18 acetylase RimI-like enzyme
VDRIESQLLLHSHGVHSSVFRAAGFEIYRRLFMRLNMLEPPPASPAAPALPAELYMRQWHEDDFNEAAHLISAAYHGHLDSHINDQYRSVAGSLRFLHNIVRFPGCGLFDGQASRVLARSGSHEIVAMLLCSRVREDVAHITQLCVGKENRGQHLGRILIDDCAAHLKARGFRAITLTVTESNESAVALYRHAGFEVAHSFDAMLWEKPRSNVGN